MPCIIIITNVFIGESFANVKLQAGDDAGDVVWTEARAGMKLYASHLSFMEQTVVLRKGDW